MTGDGRRPRVLVATSGGVDSAAAACLLLEQGYDVQAAFLCLRRAGDSANERACCSPQDADDAQRVADLLNVRLTVLPVTRQFHWLAATTARQYAAGKTPNPCVICNARIKIGMLLELADRLGAEWLATGHYARRLTRDGQVRLARPANRDKDQSYVLFALEESQRRRLLLPLGELPDKHAVRQIARRHSLPVADKPDSQDGCFLPAGGVAELLARHCPVGLRPGPILDLAGRELGRHQGYGCFTVGQRRGLGFAAGEPMYVRGIDPASAAVIVGPRQALAVGGLSASGAVWHTRTPPVFEAMVQVRYNGSIVPAIVERLADARFHARFGRPFGPVAPGQAAVVYDEQDRVMGGGWIDATSPVSPGDHSPATRPS